MKDEHIDELIDLYALGALEPAEQFAVDEHLDECPRCRERLAEAKQVVMLLAWTPDQHDPPPSLRNNVMRRAKQLQRLDGTRDLNWWQRLNSRLWRPMPSFALQLGGAAALVAALVLGGRTVQLQREVTMLRTQLQQQQPVFQVLQAADARLISITTQRDNTPRGYLLLSKDGRQASLVTSALGPLPRDKTYQLWLIGNAQPESAGVFSVAERGITTIAVQAPQPLSTYKFVGISVEPAGGSAQPTTDPIVLNEL